MDELMDEIGKLDFDKVTETFGDNFGPQPDFHTTKTVEELREELEGVVDLEEVGGIFDLPKGSQVQLPMESGVDEEAMDMDLETDPDDDDEEDPEEYDELLEQLSEHDPVRQATQEEMTRKGKVLLNLINSGKNFEDVLEEHIHEVDDLLLRMLDGRIAQAEADKESKEITEGLIFLFERLASEMERKRAPDEMKLLDACLAIMIPEEVYEDPEDMDMNGRRAETMQLLEEALAPPGVHGLNVDPFTLMNAIGRQQDLDVEALEAQRLMGNDISQESFVEAVQTTIKEVEESQKMEFLTLKKWSDEIKASQDGEREKEVFRKQIQQMSMKLMGQRQVLAVTKEVLEMAKSIIWERAG